MHVLFCPFDQEGVCNVQHIRTYTHTKTHIRIHAYAHTTTNKPIYTNTLTKNYQTNTYKQNTHALGNTRIHTPLKKEIVTPNYLKQMRLL